MNAARLAVDNITKSYGPVRALKGVSLAFHSGTVHGIAGHNGAGKSTLVRAIGGLEIPDTGAILVDGQEQRFQSPSDSIDAGISIVQQTPQVADTLTVAENLFLGRQDRGRAGLISWKSLNARAEEELAKIGVKMNPKAIVADLSMAERQLIEIARATSRSSRVLVMDEPTTALSMREVDRLFGVVRELRSQGVALVLIDHKLDEVMEICDEVSVLRDGAKVASSAIADTNADKLADAIVGHEHTEDELSRLEPSTPAPGTPRLEVRKLARGSIYDNISFDLRAGEIVGIAGLVGSGRSRMAKALAGIEPADRGEFFLDGTRTRIANVSDAHDAKIAYVPEDRATFGLFLDMSIEANITLGSLESATKRGMLDHKTEHALATEYAKRMGVIFSDIHQPVGELSGGNQQKVLLARWLAFNPSVLILDEPTQGIDIGVKEDIYRLLRVLAREQLALLVISSEFEELLNVCDRILVVRDGRIIAERTVDELDGPSDLVKLVSDDRTNSVEIPS